MKLRYSEGSWFAVPLQHGGYVVGVVARAGAKGKVILCYFFGPRRDSVSPLSDVEMLEPGKAICAWRVGDLFLQRGRWEIIGKSASWNRAAWPMPSFVQRDPLGSRVWRASYSDDDPNKLVALEPVSNGIGSLEEDTMHGAEAAEIELTKLTELAGSAGV